MKNQVKNKIRNLSIICTKKKISWLQIRLLRIAHRLAPRLLYLDFSLMNKWKKKNHLNLLSVSLLKQNDTK